MHVLRKYFLLWYVLTKNSFLVTLTSTFSVVLYILGKLLRFIFTFIFLSSILQHTKSLGSYTSNEVFLFFMTFIVIDSMSQLFFREVYRFRPLVIRGDLDLILTKPMNPLFRALVGGTDPMDLIMTFPFIGILIYYIVALHAQSWLYYIGYIILFINGFLIAASFHILVLALTIITSEIDHTIMIYRDLSGMGKVPIDIYKEPLRSIITFIIPIGIMMSFPVKIFLHMLTVPMIMLAIFIGLVFFLFSLLIWRMAIRRYASASS